MKKPRTFTILSIVALAASFIPQALAVDKKALAASIEKAAEALKEIEGFGEEDQADSKIINKWADTIPQIDDPEVKQAMLDGMKAAWRMAERRGAKNESLENILRDLMKDLLWAAAVSAQPLPEPEVKVGDEFPKLPLRDGKSYLNVRVKSFDAGAAFFSHEGGMARVKLADMDDEFRTKFGYDPVAAREAEARYAEVQSQQRDRMRAEEQRMREEAEASRTAQASPTPAKSVSAVEGTIRAKAAERWGDDYNMQVYEVKKQVEAFKEIQGMKRNGSVPKNIFDLAAERWGDDYSMQVYEIKKQTEALSSLK